MAHCLAVLSAAALQTLPLQDNYWRKWGAADAPDAFEPTPSLKARLNSRRRSVGCGSKLPSGVNPGGSTTMAGTFDGIKRQWVLYLPPGYDNSVAVPMVVGTHGWGGSGSQEEKSSGLTTVSGKGGGFIAAFPDGYADNAGFGFWGSWNVVGSTQSPGADGQICTPTADPSNSDCYSSCGGCSGADGCDWTTCLNDITPSGIGTKDVSGFLPSLYDYLEETFCVDLTREYHEGMSNGGMATYQMGASMSSRLAAIVPVAGAFHNGFQQAPYEKLPLLDIHGYNDKQVPCNASTTGSTSTKALSQDGWWYNLLSDTAAGWLEANGCSKPPALGNYVPPLISSSTASKHKLGCTDHGCDVVTCAWDGAHTYFGATAEDNGNLVWGFMEAYTKATHVGYGYSEATPPEQRVRTRAPIVDVAALDTDAAAVAEALPRLDGPADSSVRPANQTASGMVESATHYGNPAHGCQHDEEVIMVSSGVASGRFCAPKKLGPSTPASAADESKTPCMLGGTTPNAKNGCPLDAPPPSVGERSAFPVCLQDDTVGAASDTHCALLCGPCRVGADGEGCADIAHASCPAEARCVTGTVKSVRQGVCLYA